MGKSTVVLTSIFVITTLVLMSGWAVGKILVTNNPNYQDDPAFYKTVANEFASQENFEDAIFNYEKSLELKDDLDVRNNLAIFYYKQSEYSKAIGQLRVLVVARPENPSHHYDLAVNLVDRFRNTDEKSVEDLVEALREYETANRLSPGFSNSENNIVALKRVLQIKE